MEEKNKLTKELAKEIEFPYWYNTRANKDYVDIRIQINKNVLQFIVHKSRVRNSSARIFILWITIPSILLLMISILFFKGSSTLSLSISWIYLL